VRVAILDGGFWVDANGQPNSVPGIGTDLPTNPIQFDFVNDDNIVGSTNPTQCSGGSSCPWHGNGAVGAALGLVNNQAGAAGTGGLVADPMLFHIITTTSQQKLALGTARSWGADVISMSFGDGCDYACRWEERLVGYDEELARVRAAGIVIVAAAGNDGQNVDSEYFHPCNYDGVICVGALNDDTNTPQGYSNYGGSVDIWAPTNFPVMPDGAKMTVHNFGGTSASAPFIAGIAAMMKAVNPNLNSDQVRDMMRDSAWTDSGDSKVSHYINALEAVKRASNNELPADRFEPNPPDSPAALNTGQYDDLSVHKASESDFYRVTANGASKLTLNFTSPDNLGKLGFGYGLLRDKGCGWQEELENTSSANARKLVYRIPSGVFTLGLGSSQPLPYDMTMTLEGTTILPDGFEPNNTFAAARFLLDGSVNATLHAGDVDFYQVYSTGSLLPPPGGYGYESLIVLRAADSPVTLRLYNAAGNVVSTATTSADCTVLAKLGNLPQGFWTYSVTSNVPGNYNLFAGQKLLRGKPLYDMDSFWRLIMNPSDPVEFIVHDKLEWASLVFNQDGIPNGLDLFTPGLHLALFDDNGLQISTGAATDFQGTLGETLDLSQTQSGARYYLRLERTASTELTESQLPIIRATLKLR
jgi:Subtilase family